MELLPFFNRSQLLYPTAKSWLFNSEIRFSIGFASSERTLLWGFYNMARNKKTIKFMVTTEKEALSELAQTRPGMLIVTPYLEQGSGLAVIEKARSVVDDIRTLLIVNQQTDNLIEAGLSKADAVMSEADGFNEKPLFFTMFRAIALGQRFRSESILKALAEANVAREIWRDSPPELSPGEWEIVPLLVNGLGDREIAETLKINYETARSRSKALRRKLGVGNRAQAVTRLLQLGLARMVGP